MSQKDLLEKISDLEHVQWIHFSEGVIDQVEQVDPDRAARWRKYFVPYAELDEHVKDLDRDFARKVLCVVFKEINEIMEFNESGDAYYNLMGALEDMKHGVGNDHIIKNTIHEVDCQLGKLSVLTDTRNIDSNDE